MAYIQSRAALEGLNMNGEVRILIVGLRTKKSRREFHAFGMRPENKYYVPFKLCYAPETGAIFPAAVATCALKEIRDTTLCGRLIVIRSSNLGPRTSTVGGFLKIKDQFFALTTSRMPEDSDQMLENDSNRMTEKHSDAVLVFDDEAFERGWNYLDEALLSNSDDEVDDSDTQAGDSHVLDDDGEEREELGRDSSHDMTIDGNYVMFRVNEERMQAGEDWQLVPVDLEHLLPNKIPERGRSSRGPRRSVQVDIPRERYNVENLNVANARVHSGQYLHYVIPIAVCYMALILLMNFGREYSPRSQLFGQVLALPMLELGL
ncbi:hypothetical protein CGLO_03017 [Colletotrichum gloeosporioides Cg-14]|uniref:Uncharacterized protein n=1 Tax=Colletotrichum gloeosporioides (strain Cg-14) TaxID=1237896 RepID=T0KXQ2_COLGC|nr:hypothetical protein CGLO_03017 [Colletotrichum gloeosporioides Cg-14]